MIWGYFIFKRPQPGGSIIKPTIILEFITNMTAVY